jgi:hypothetical protein
MMLVSRARDCAVLVWDRAALCLLFHRAFMDRLFAIRICSCLC